MLIVPGLAEAVGAELSDPPPEDGSVSAPEAIAPNFDRRRAVEQILRSPLPRSAYRQGIRCIPPGGYRAIEVLDDKTLVFVGSGSQSWIAHARRRCPGLRPDVMVHFEGRRICAGTPFQGVTLLRTLEPVTAVCAVAELQAVDQDQLEALRYALTANARTRTLTETYRQSVPL